MRPPDAPEPCHGEPADHPLVQCFNACRGELLGTLAYVLGSRDAALDAAQDAFLKCWKARDAVPDVGNLRAWVFKVAINAARDSKRSAWNRKAKPLVSEDAMPATNEPDVGAALEDAEDLAALREAITGLRPDEQEVFLLRQNGGLTYEAIADLRGAPVGTVKTQMRTALIKLRRALNSADPDPGG